MNASRESFLVESLKHVSLQRLRKLKMDMDGVARDSKINDERAFWSLLEYHNIHLDDRTKLDFYKRVSNNKGIDVEVAIKLLKKAQRKTGRDSVEVLKKVDDEEALSQETPKLPAATPVSVAPLQKLSIQPRSATSYKLDNLRKKIRGLGKLQLAIKAVDPGKNKESNQSEPATSENQTKTQAKDGYSTSTKVKTNSSNLPPMETSESFLKLPLKNKTTHQQKINAKPEKKEANNEKLDATNKIEKKQTEKSTSEDKSSDEKKMTNNVFSSNVNAKSKLESTTSDDPSFDEKQNLVKPESQQIQKNVTSVENENVLENATIPPPSPDKIEVNEKPNEFNINNNNALDTKSSEVLDSVLPSCSFFVETIDSVGKQEKDDPAKQSKDQPKILKNKSGFLQVNDDNQEVSKQMDAKGTVDNADSSLALVESNAECLNKYSTFDETNVCYDDIDNNSKDKEKVINDTKTKTDSTETEDDEVPLNILQSDIDCPTEHVATEKENSLKNKHKDVRFKNGNNAEQKLSETGDIETKSIVTHEENNIDEENKTNEKKENEEENQIAQESKAAKNSKETVFDQSDAAKLDKNLADWEKKQISCLEETVEKTKDLFAFDDDNKDNITKGTVEKEKSSRSDHLSIEKLSNLSSITAIEATDKTQPDDKDEKSSKYSRSTVSSADENDVSLLEDILKENQIGSCSVETLKVGKNIVNIPVATTFPLDNESFSDFPEPQVDWVYGCNTSHSQCMSSTHQGELLYFGGCIVIIYDPIGNSQRFYLEHSAPITCLTTHSSENLVATAQKECSSKTYEPNQSNASSCNGVCHVRVWNYIRLETLRVIGSGILRHPIYKMTFLNVTDYFLTIEQNEDYTMTLWDGGCRVTGKSSSFSEPQTESKVEEIKPTKKRFVPTRPRSNYNPPQETRSQKTTLQEEKMRSMKLSLGPKSVAGNLTEELCYVTVGKCHLSFWKVEEIVATNAEEKEGYQITEPEYGDFGKSFRAEYITSCVASSKYLDGSILTGDSNGTLLIWSEASKVAVKGFPHAHECSISSICLSEEGVLFTAGSKDNLVKAFNIRKNKIENIGKIVIPFGLGSGSCLACIEKTLFVSTEKNVILSVSLESKPISNVSSSLPSKTFANAQITPRHLCFSGSTFKQFGQIQNNTDENEGKNHGIFTSWSRHEVARGFVNGVRCVKPIKQLHVKLRHRTVDSEPAVLAMMPSMNESISILHRQLAKSARGTKQRAAFSRVKPPKETMYAWKNPDSTEKNDLRKPIPSASSPRLRTNERMLIKEKALKTNRLKAIPPCGRTNYVKKSEIFPAEDQAKQSEDLFVTVSTDGWLLIFNSNEHKIHARCKFTVNGEVLNIDTCSRRHLVVCGTTTGQLITARINPNGFEILPSVKCRCSGRGPPKINAVKFSPSGTKLAVSIGYDVIIYDVRRLRLAEKGRCIGHHSDCIISINWTKKKVTGKYYLRTCAVQPVAELKVWDAVTFTEVNACEVSHEPLWDSNAYFDYGMKGIWNAFLCPTELSSFVLINAKLKKPTNSHVFAMTDDDSWKRSHSDNERRQIVFIGDVNGSVFLQSYPCLKWSQNPQLIKSFHCSGITSISASLHEDHVLTTTEKDSIIVQWTFKSVTDG